MARRGRPTSKIELSDDERETLERWARRPKSAQSLALRCRIVLKCAEGLTNGEVARDTSDLRPYTVASRGSLMKMSALSFLAFRQGGSA